MMDGIFGCVAPSNVAWLRFLIIPSCDPAYWWVASIRIRLSLLWLARPFRYVRALTVKSVKGVWKSERKPVQLFHCTEITTVFVYFLLYSKRDADIQCDSIYLVNHRGYISEGPFSLWVKWIHHGLSSKSGTWAIFYALHELSKKLYYQTTQNPLDHFAEFFYSNQKCF